jgi:hypothetical protein
MKVLEGQETNANYPVSGYVSMVGQSVESRARPSLVTVVEVWWLKCMFTRN